MGELEKNELIEQKVRKYKTIFRHIEKDKKTFAEKLYKQAAFMEITLDDLQETINKEGPVIESINGNGFTTTQEHPAQKSYNTMIRNYNTVIKTLVDMLPEDKDDRDELTAFLLRDKK